MPTGYTLTEKDFKEFLIKAFHNRSYIPSYLDPKYTQSCYSKGADKCLKQQK